MLITLKQVSSHKVDVSHIRTIKLWVIANENDEFLVIYLKYVSGLSIIVNRARTPKPLAIAHENGHKHENDEFLDITPSDVSGLIGHANHH